jgi:membrane protease YdiL (CAAX protease family)
MNAAQGNRESGRAGWGPFAALMAALAVIFAAAARVYLQRYPLPMAAVAGIYVCFILSLALALAPGLRGSRAALERWFMPRRKAPALVLIWVAPYLIYAAGTGDFRWSALATLLAVGAAMVALYACFPVHEKAEFGWQDACVAGVLIAVVLSRQLRGIWNVPQNLDFVGRLYLIGAAGWCWTLVRVVPGLGYELTLRVRTLKAAGVNFVWFALLALPAGLALRFIAWNPRWRGWPQLGLDYLQIFLFIALLEELFFRGFLQTLLAKTLRSQYGAQALVACLFGLFHILHAPFPNWRYVALATVAGWFYGSAFRQGGGVMAAALMHAAVDTVWRTFFTRG